MVVGVLGSIPLRLNDNLRTIEVGIPVKLIHRRIVGVDGNSLESAGDADKR